MAETGSVRNFHPSDIPHIMDICLKTAADGEDGSAMYVDPWFIGQLYALPYVIRHPELCFVATIDEVPVGYILGTADTEGFYRWMEEEFLPTVRLRYPVDRSPVSAHEAFFLPRLHADKRLVRVDPLFPAHLHINLLAHAQGRGMGSRLMTTFLQGLRDFGAPGAYLHVGPANTPAVSFYRKMGFAVLEETEEVIKFGRSLRNIP
jgi:ribosomal protein S18 acetylase RimI-like enzyme